MTQNQPTKRRKLFQFLVCAFALLAVFSAIIYVLFEALNCVEKAEKLLAEAFLATDHDVTSRQTATSEAPITEEIPTPTERVPVTVDLSSPTLTVQNITSYAVDCDALLEHDFPKHLFDTRPMVLLYHADPEASYWPSGADAVSTSYPFTDKMREKTVVAVGETVKNVLASAGIASLHITEPVTDIATLLAEYRSTYPSIRYCLDVRRDGIYTTDGRIVKSQGKLDDCPVAQIMLAVGTDMRGKGLVWQGNLAAAVSVADMMQKAAPSVVRPVWLHPDSLSQQDEILHLTAFIGTTGNTVTEATDAARFFARYLALFILSNCGNP